MGEILPMPQYKITVTTTKDEERKWVENIWFYMQEYVVDEIIDEYNVDYYDVRDVKSFKAVEVSLKRIAKKALALILNNSLKATYRQYENLKDEIDKLSDNWNHYPVILDDVNNIIKTFKTTKDLKAFINEARIDDFKELKLKIEELAELLDAEVTYS